MFPLKTKKRGEQVNRTEQASSRQELYPVIESRVNARNLDPGKPPASTIQATAAGSIKATATYGLPSHA